MAPLSAMMSGIRNDSPISMSSPRETITSAPRASVASAGDIVANPLENLTGRVYDELSAHDICQSGKCGQSEQLVHGRNLAEQSGTRIASGVGSGTHSMHFSISCATRATWQARTPYLIGSNKRRGD